MRKLILVVAVIMVLIIFIFQGFRQPFPLPKIQETDEWENEVGEQDLESAINQYYYNVPIMGIHKATKESLALDFGVDTSGISEVYGRYSDGRFGIADMIIVRPISGQETAVRDVLMSIRNSRASLFKNYNIYESSSISESGIIYSRGNYLILLMIENADDVRDYLEDYIPA